MRAFTPWVAGSLLFALAGCSNNQPPATAKRPPGATSGRDFTAAEDVAPVTTDTGARLLAAEPLGALVVHTVPTIGPSLGTTSATMERPDAPGTLPQPASQPVYRPPTTPSRVPIAPPPPPPPPPAFPAPVKPSTPLPPGS